MPAESITRVPASQRRSAYATLTIAFSADPIMRWLYPEAELFMAEFPGLLEVYGGKSFAAQAAWRAGSSSAVSLWLPPRVDVDGEAFVDYMIRTVAADKHDELLSVVEQMGERHPPEPVWYLALLGVDAALQGQGLGAQLMTHDLKIVDHDHLPAYLDSSNPSNVPFYERHGFEVVGEARAGGAPPIVSMLRPAR